MKGLEKECSDNPYIKRRKKSPRRKNVVGAIHKMVLGNLFPGLQKYSKNAKAIRLAETERHAKEKKLSKRDKDLARGRELLAQQKRIRQEKFQRTGFAVGQQVSQFRPPQEDFSFQEQVLRETFGRGEKIWGTDMQPVKIYNDLNPRQRGDRGTAELFGF